MKLQRLAAVVAVVLATSSSALAQSTIGPSLHIDKDNRTISISASDHVESEPDIADIQIGFTAYGQTLKTDL